MTMTVDTPTPARRNGTAGLDDEDYAEARSAEDEFDLLMSKINEIMEERRTQTWRRYARCASGGGLTSHFFPDKGFVGVDTAGTSRSICDLCVVEAECRQFGVDSKIPYGTWGGNTAAELAAIRRNERCTDATPVDIKRAS